MSPLQRIKQAMQKRLRFKEDDALVVDATVSCLTASCHKDLEERVWLQVVGPPSSGKTESVLPFSGDEMAVFISELTENSLMSSYVSENGDEDMSLIPKLDGKLLVIKDLTLTLDLPPKQRDKVIATLRDAYDGETGRASGTKGTQQYKSKFGVLACVTDEIDQFMARHQRLGERFLMFRMQREPLAFKERHERSYHVMSQALDKKDQWKAELRAAVQESLKEIRVLCRQNPRLPLKEEDVWSILRPGDLLALLRTSSGNETAISPEMGGRVCQQLMNLGRAHMIADGRTEWGPSEDALVRRVAVDSLEPLRKRIVRAMYKLGPHRPARPMKWLEERVGSTRGKILPALNQMLYVGVTERPQEDDVSHEPLFKLSGDAYEAIKESRLFE